MFTQLLRERPDLTATVANLVEDHKLIASILSRVNELADSAAESHGQILESVGRELDGLAAIMESHFGYEERTLSQALDGGVPDDQGGSACHSAADAEGFSRAARSEIAFG